MSLEFTPTDLRWVIQSRDFIPVSFIQLDPASSGNDGEEKGCT